MSDYLQLPLYIEQDELVDIIIHLDNDKIVLIKDVYEDPVRYGGWWTISYHYFYKKAAARFDADKILYFTILGRSNGE